MYKIRSLPQVSKIEILFSGPVEVLRRFQASMPEGQCGAIAESPVPPYTHSMFIYAHSLELEKNVRTLLDKLIAGQGETPSVEPRPLTAASAPQAASAGTTAKPRSMIGIAAAAIVFVAVSVGGFMYFSDSGKKPSAGPSAMSFEAGKAPAKKSKAPPSKKRDPSTPDAPKVLAQYTAPDDPAADAGLGKLTVHMVDVRQGDALFLVFPSGKNMLIDGGEPKGKSGLMSFLASKRAGRIDYLVITHPHLDHMAALTDILDKYEIGQVIEPAYPHSTRAYQKLLDKVRDKGIDYVQAKHGMTVKVGAGVSVRVLSPPSSFLDNTRSDVNNASVVLHVKHGAVSFLFTGDIEAEIEDKLTDQGGIRATVLKAPHHGGAHSSQSAFLEEVSPSIVLISCGAGNSYGHPAPSSLMRYKKVGAKIYRTDKVGTITVVSDGKTVRVNTENGGDPA